jgi:PKD repeat protein
VKRTIAISISLAIGFACKAQSYCIPQTQTYCCGYGITSVILPGLVQTSPDASEGYRDFTAQTCTVDEGAEINVQIQTGGIEPHDTRIWLDANNDGIFSHPSEMVFESLNAISPAGNLNIPQGALLGTALRLRITADFVGSNPQPCTHPTFGQTEDYSFTMMQAGEIPVADFTVSKTSSCNGIILFEQQCMGNPTSYLWDLGDGNTSTHPIFTHAYSENGIYTVSLVVSNSLGSDTLVKNDYLHVNISETCDTFAIPAQGTYSVLYECNYVITDNGGSANYSDNTNGVISLSPLWAEKVCLKFSEFHYETEFDYIEIFDGASPAAPLIGKYTGNVLPPEICSTGPALCIRQRTDDLVNYSGFMAQANCTLDYDEFSAPFPVSVYPNPFTDQFTISLPVHGIDNWGVSILSITGREVFRQSFTYQTSATISLPHITAGIYVVEIQSPAGSWQQKIIKLP